MEDVKEVLEVIEKIKGSLMRREYKDSVFRYLFGRYENKENLLSLYNALNGTDYKNKDDLRINTIDGILSLGVHNDVSFILDSQMMLYEHQSTYCQNMPLRGLVYFTILYYKEIFNEKSIYNSKRLMIPTPRYVVFYNGQDKDLPDKVIQRLSDSFENPKDCDGFEWTATILNINYGHNKEILLKCRVLEEYSLFVQCVRKHLAKENNRDIAINNAIDECVNNNILRDFLTKCKAEVIGMLDYEHSVLKEWEKLCKGYIEEGYEKRQPEVDALKKETAEAKQETAEAKQETAEAKQETAEAKQETVLAKQEAAEAKQRADQEKARADKIEAEIFADREKIIRDIAINNAIDECINNNILRDFLTKCRAEVIGMLDYEHDVLREWEKLCKGYIEEGYEKRQPEVDALKKEVAEAEQRTADAEQRTAEAEQRANDAEAGQVQIIMNMLSKGKTKEDIIDLTGITEERYIALMKIN